MRNLLLAILAGVVTWAGFTLAPGLTILQSILPGVFVVGLVYYLLAKRSFKRLEALLIKAAKSLQTMPPKFDLAISEMEKAYELAPIQIGVRSQIDSQIGVVYFLQQKFDKALPFLERSLAWGHWLGGAMLAVIYYKKKNQDEMRKTMDIVVKRSKKQALPWCLYGYLLAQSGDRDRAQAVLVDGVKATQDDQKVKDALLAVQNNRKIKMKVFKEQWYQFHLERPPAQHQQVIAGGRMSKQQRRGRW